MSSRIRNSNARPTVARRSAAATPNRTTVNELPPYKKPSHPLNAEAARELRALQGDSAKQVKKHNDQAVEVIRSAAEGVNDMLRDHSEYLNRRQKKWDAGRNLDDKEDEERRMQDLSEQVDEATAKLEESMRAIIDNGMAAQRMDETLEWVQQNAPRQLQEEYQTQMTQRATQRQTQAENQDADGDEDMEDAPTPGPTPLDGSRVTLTGVSELFSTRQERQKDIYTSLSLTARYARNNHYRDFKRIVHDAKFAEEGPALGDEETWFTEAGSPAPGITNTQRGDFDDGDDIVMNKAKISTRCPITFQEYKEPYTSIKCPHTFEKVAIIEMIRAQRGGIECPIPGCSKVLKQEDLRSDPVTIRAIRRLQASRDAESSDDDEVQAPRNTALHTQVLATQQPPQSSIIEDPGEPSEDEPMTQLPESSNVEDLGDPSDSDE